MTRKQAREEAFILIFEKEFNDESVENILEINEAVREIVPDEYMKDAFIGVYNNLEEIDNCISENAKGWSLKRISKVALAVLRLAIYEMKFVDSIPVSVSINEAVELCKKYATKDDSAFVNGILATISKAND
ncbi:MAG: transcription antitermination factor NusB [Clostridia bacterium]|nr:transcription antitermination factor NusB [Clostridia bacterium]